MAEREATVVWEGDSRQIVRSFPADVRRNIGADIYRLQLGEAPHDSRPMKSIGQGVFELRQRDRNGWYRLIYLARLHEKLYMPAWIYQEVGENES